MDPNDELSVGFIRVDKSILLFQNQDHSQKTLPAIIVSSIMTWGLERSINRRRKTKTIH